MEGWQRLRNLYWSQLWSFTLLLFKLNLEHFGFSILNGINTAVISFKAELSFWEFVSLADLEGYIMGIIASIFLVNMFDMLHLVFKTLNSNMFSGYLDRLSKGSCWGSCSVINVHWCRLSWRTPLLSEVRRAHNWNRLLLLFMSLSKIFIILIDSCIPMRNRVYKWK